VSQNGMFIIRLVELFGAILKDIKNHVGQAEIAFRFHASLADAIATMCCELSAQSGVRTVALCGGVFQNRLLTQMVATALRARELCVITHRQVPTNDGGIALGQAAIAAFSKI